MRVIIVYTSDHVLTALEEASNLKKPLAMQSAPDAIFYAGSLYLLHMFERARQQFLSVDARFILDCGNAAAEAVSAMRIGHKHIRSSAPKEIRAKILDIAGQYEAEVHGESYEALDLLRVGDTKGACRQWLNEGAL